MRIGLALLLTMLTGCGGRYILTVPEQVGPTGGQAVVVARLQMEEFVNFPRAVKDVALRFRVEDGPQRGAYTDKIGYAAAMVPLPAKAGRYHVTVEHTDKDGREVGRFTPVYAWDAQTPVVAVDLDSIASPGGTKGTPAGQALDKISQHANILYLTQRPLREHANLRGRLKGGGFPDGPILLWQREYWHVAREGVLTKVVVEDRLISQLPSLKKQFPNFVMGITNSTSAVQTFLTAGIKPVYIGQEAWFLPRVPPDARRSSWMELAKTGL